MLRPRLTYANVASTTALVLALGGSAYAVGSAAKPPTIKACVAKAGGAARIVATKAKCKSTERTVTWNQKGLTGATGPAGSPDTAAQVLTKLLTVDGSGSGLDADKLDGKNSTDLVGTTATVSGDLTGTVLAPTLAANEAYHQVGATGQPAFANSWVNSALGIVPTNAAFRKDRNGVVHIIGQIASGTVSPDPASSTVFTLPAGYRPSGDRIFSTLTTNGSNVITAGWVAVDSSGEVFVGVGDNHYVSIDITFAP